MHLGTDAAGPHGYAHLRTLSRTPPPLCRVGLLLGRVWQDAAVCCRDFAGPVYTVLEGLLAELAPYFTHGYVRT
jgi:hypothetical protein